MLGVGGPLPSFITTTYSLETPQSMQKPNQYTKLFKKCTALKTYNLKWHPKCYDHFCTFSYLTIFRVLTKFFYFSPKEGNTQILGID